MLKRFYFPGKAIYLLRAFFPSWRFFEDLGEAPVLFYRVRKSDQEFGPWEYCLEKPKRQLHSIFLNPQGNFLLACSSLLQQLTADVEENSPEQGVAYKLTKDLVHFYILKNKSSHEPIWYQFKVSTITQDQADAPIEDFLISPIYEA